MTSIRQSKPADIPDTELNETTIAQNASAIWGNSSILVIRKPRGWVIGDGAEELHRCVIEACEGNGNDSQDIGRNPG
jgi:hypothetical protein